MPLSDTKGVPWAHSLTVEAGDNVRCDGGFTCLREGTVRVVQEDDDGLYIECEDGKHYLDGQEGDDGELIGLYPATGYVASDDRPTDLPGCWLT